MTSSPTEAQTKTFSDALWLAAILVVALALRIPGLNGPLWFDEIDTLVSYVRLPIGELVTTYPSLNNHIFFSVQANLSVGAFGESPWALRLPALVLGMGSLWALWLLARDIIGQRQALLATALMAVSYHHVWFSQNARGYTGLLFWGLLATWLLLRGARSDARGPWVAYGLCFAASMYTHLSGAFLFAAHAVVYLLALLGTMALRRPSLPFLNPLIGAAVGLAITTVVYAPIAGDVLATFTEVATEVQSEAFTASIAHFDSPIWTALEAVRSVAGGGPVGLIAPLIAIVPLVAVVALLRQNAMFALLLPVQIALTLVILQTVGMRVWPRYFFVDIGIVCLLLTHGAALVGTGLARLTGWMQPTRAATIAVVLGIMASLALLPRNYLHPKQDYAGAAAFVEARRAADAPVVALGLTAFPFRIYYAPQWQEADDLATFRALTDGKDEAWVVYTFPNVIRRRHADILQAMQGRFEEVRYFHGTLGDGGIVVMRTIGGGS